MYLYDNPTTLTIGMKHECFLLNEISLNQTVYDFMRFKNFCKLELRQ